MLIFKKVNKNETKTLSLKNKWRGGGAWSPVVV